MYCQAGSPFPTWAPIPQFDLDFAEENLQELAVHFPDLVAGLLPEFGHLTGQIVLQAALDLLLQQINVFPCHFMSSHHSNDNPRGCPNPNRNRRDNLRCTEKGGHIYNGGNIPGSVQ